MTPRSFTTAAGALAALVLLAGCGTIRPAQMALPEGLQNSGPAAEPLRFEGLGWGRSGRFTLAGERVDYTRGADRLELLETLTLDRAAVTWALQRGDGTRTDASCRARRAELSVGVLVGTPRAMTFSCTIGNGPGTATAQLDVHERAAAAGTRSERHGRYAAGALTLELQSVHRVQGSALPLAQPVGYVFTHQGRAVGALDLTGTPQLWRPQSGDAALAQAVTHSALALALLWDPASR